MSTAEQQRRWRAAHGAATGASGRKPTKGHGSLAAYRRHLRAGTEPCAKCRAANAEHSRRYRASPAYQDRWL
ncbi:MAG TPA: hypothetical protein VLL25_16805 [Acidimicrobiales bacterium]|nr:hypothetical protein [Acidimicrobiales bacterium]